MSLFESNSTTIIANVPSCSVHTSLADYKWADAAAFDLTDSSYYMSIWQSWVPGVVLGGVSALCGAWFLAWLLSLLCRQHCWLHEVEKLPGNASDGSIANEKKRRWCGAVLLPVLTIVMLLATIGLSTWGLVETLDKTGDTITTFWNTFDTAETRVVAIAQVGNSALKDLDTINIAITAIAEGKAPTSPPPSSASSGAPDGVQLQSVNETVASAISSEVQSTAQQIQGQLNGAIQQGRQAMEELKNKGIQGLQDFESKYKSTSLKVQNNWRQIVIAVFFSLVIADSILAALTALSNKWPRMSSFFTLMLWLLTTLLMLLGAGLMAGVFEVSSDACLYAEGYSLREVRQHVNNPERVLFGMHYYFGAVEMPSQEVAQKVYNLNTTMIYNTVSSVQPVMDFVSSDEGRKFLDQLESQGAASNFIQMVEDLPTLVNSTVAKVQQLEGYVQSRNWADLYADSKALLCCNINHGVYYLWISWTATGCAALVLSVLLTVRVMATVVVIRKPRPQSQHKSSTRAQFATA